MFADTRAPKIARDTEGGRLSPLESACHFRKCLKCAEKAGDSGVGGQNSESASRFWEVSFPQVGLSEEAAKTRV
jgi:hypothetical protein